MPNVSKQLKKFRAQKGWSQEDLAAAAGVAVGTVQNAEYGKETRVSTARSLAAALDIAFVDLLEDREDSIASGPLDVRSYLAQWLTPPNAAYCIDEKEVRTFARKMVTQFQSDFQAGEKTETWKRFRDAYSGVDIHKDRIIESYITAWHACNETFMFAVRSQKRIGLSAIWPLTDEAYESLRSGTISFADIRSSDIKKGSQNLFVNSAFELVPTARLPWSKITDGIFHLILYQLAAMSSDPWKNSFRMICFTGTPDNHQRAIGNGFISLNRNMADIPFPLYEFPSLSDGRSAETDHVRLALLSAAGAFSPARLKRRTLRAVLAAYRRALNPSVQKAA